MKCKLCNKEPRLLTHGEVSFLYCPSCHVVLDDDGNLKIKCESHVTNEEDVLQWLMGGGSNMNAGNE